jgi:hypothetical protein
MIVPSVCRAENRALNRVAVSVLKTLTSSLTLRNNCAEPFEPWLLGEREVQGLWARRETLVKEFWCRS